MPALEPGSVSGRLPPACTWRSDESVTAAERRRRYRHRVDRPTALEHRLATSRSARRPPGAAIEQTAWRCSSRAQVLRPPWSAARTWAASTRVHHGSTSLRTGGSTRRIGVPAKRRPAGVSPPPVPGRPRALYGGARLIFVRSVVRCFLALQSAIGLGHGPRIRPSTSTSRPQPRLFVGKRGACRPPAGDHRRWSCNAEQACQVVPKSLAQIAHCDSALSGERRGRVS
jgi:hypothetical protein